jgi:O-antigen/teichoic acid export membrane protein
MVRKLYEENVAQPWETEILPANLKQRAIFSYIATFVGQPIKVAIGIGTTALLARVLTPADFGVVAMMLPLLAIVESISNLGLETAIVQRERLDQQQASAVFWLSLKINGLIVAGMVLMGPVLAQFYQEQSLRGITVVMAVGVSSLCLSFQHKSLLKRQMRFGVLNAIDVVALLAGSGVAIAAAWLGWSYWALVFQIVVPQIVQSLAYWLLCPWRPTRPIRRLQDNPELRAMLAYGTHLSGFHVVTQLGLKLDQVLVGYIGGASTLGLYSMAYQWAYFPFNQTYLPLIDVAISSLSRAVCEPQQYRHYCRQVLALMFGLCMPALAFLFISAQDFILFLLGNQWLVAVPIFRILSIAVFVGCLYRVTKWIYASVGQTQRQLRWGFFHTGVMIVAVATGSYWGAVGVAIGYTTATCLLTFPAVAFCLKIAPLSLGDFFRTAQRPASASIASALLLFAIRFALPEPPLLIVSLLVNAIIFSALYVGLYVLLPGGMKEAISLIQELKTLSNK